MNNPFSAEVILDSPLSTAQAGQKWKQEVESCARKGKTKGKALFLHSFKEGKCVLHYYQNYGGDFCDTVFTGEISEYDNGSQITGNVTVPKSMRWFAAALIVASIPLSILFNFILYRVVPSLSGSSYMIEVSTFVGAMLALIAIAIMSLMTDKRKVKVIMDYLHEFLREKESAL